MIIVNELNLTSNPKTYFDYTILLMSISLKPFFHAHTRRATESNARKVSVELFHVDIARPRIEFQFPG